MREAAVHDKAYKEYDLKIKKKSQSVGLTMESVVTKRRGWTQH